MKIDTIVLDFIKARVKKLMQMGSTAPHAVSVVCQDMDLNPYKVLQRLFPTKDADDIKYDDIKSAEGSYVVFKNNPDKQYEVINIVNKDNIVIRDLDNNSELRVKEEEIKPVVMETNQMKENLNEANYNLSIDGLETVDAETLSTILTLADQAEGNTESEVQPVTEPVVDTDEETVVSDEEPVVDTDEDEFPTGAFEELPMEMQDDGETVQYTEDDYYYEDEPDEELDEPIEAQSEEILTTELPDDMETSVNEDVLLDPQSDDETYNAKRKFDQGEEELEEKEELVAGEELGEDIDFDEEINEVLKAAGVQLDEVSEEDATEGKKDIPTLIGDDVDFMKDTMDGDEAGENQRPNYHAVKNREKMGKQGSEGMGVTLNVGKDICNESRIKSICETAKSMYAKKDKSSWLALDRRYVDKLIREGVGYSRASQLLLRAKAGK